MLMSIYWGWCSLKREINIKIWFLFLHLFWRFNDYQFLYVPHSLRPRIIIFMKHFYILCFIESTSVWNWLEIMRKKSRKRRQKIEKFKVKKKWDWKTAAWAVNGVKIHTPENVHKNIIDCLGCSQVDGILILFVESVEILCKWMRTENWVSLSGFYTQINS